MSTNEKLVQALELIEDRFRRITSGKPVRDVSEALSEVSAAIAAYRATPPQAEAAQPAGEPVAWQRRDVNIVTGQWSDWREDRDPEEALNPRYAERRPLYTPPPQVQRAGLTDEQIDRHSIAAADCPPSSTVILVSSLRRLLGITATKGDRHD